MENTTAEFEAKNAALYRTLAREALASAQHAQTRTRRDTFTKFAAYWHARAAQAEYFEAVARDAAQLQDARAVGA